MASQAWNQTVGKPFHQRSRELSISLKKWVKKKKPLAQQLNDIENELSIIQQGPPHLIDHSKEDNLIQQHNLIMDKITDYYRQLSKKHWATKGDRNTKFFQNACTRRRQKNRIMFIHNNSGHVVSSLQDIAHEFTNYFTNLFTSSFPMQHFNFNHEGTITNEYTNSTPSVDECLQIIKSMRLTAAPGPDGLNVAFYRAAWPWIKQDVHKLVTEFYNSGSFPKTLNATEIILIPKKAHANHVTDYRPISLTNVIYRLIAKSLANRIKEDLPNYIHHSQHAFIQGRRITDNIIIAQEIVHSFNLKSFNQEAFMLKIDLAKAFDRIEWSFIYDALRRKGYHGQFIQLVHACLSTTSFSVNVNGESSGNFQATRGIRQGCPLSPYLFVLAINELSLRLQDSMDSAELTGVTLGPGCPPIHSILFADDLIICGKADIHEVLIINNILQNFCAMSGQTPSWAKSSILFSKRVSEAIKIQIKAIFPVADFKPNTMHLGHPLLINHRDKSKAYDFIYQKFKSRLTITKANTLNHAGRLTLIQSVFASIPIYYMANILFSKHFLAKITTIIRTFWWQGIQKENHKKPIHYRSWDAICTPKKEGGLGITNLELVNKGMLINSAWRLVHDSESIVAKVIKAKYFPYTSLWTAPTYVPKSTFWASILNIREHLEKHVTIQLVEGNTSIWNQPWCSIWKEMHDRLNLEQSDYQIPNKVSDLWITNSKRWDASKITTLFGQQTLDILLQIHPIAGSGPDILCWEPTSDGKCSTKSAYKVLATEQTMNRSPDGVPLQVIQILRQVWSDKTIQPRVKTFAWRVLRLALGTASRVHRIIPTISENCSRCGNLEDEKHLFFDCSYARAVWFASPIGLKTDALSSSGHGIHTKIATILQQGPSHATTGMIFSIMRCLWKSRNDHRFNNMNWSIPRVLHEAKAIDRAYNMALEEDTMSDHIHTIIPNANCVNTSATFATNMQVQEGPRIFCDASVALHSPTPGRNQAGIGILILTQPARSLSSASFFQVVRSEALEPLEAEAHALLLGARLGVALNLQVATLLTDNQVVASAAQARSSRLQPGHWLLRPILAEFEDAAGTMHFSVIKIKREANIVADSLAKQARHATFPDTCFLSCQALAHFPSCHVKEVVETFDWGFFRPICVLCL